MGQFPTMMAASFDYRCGAAKRRGRAGFGQSSARAACAVSFGFPSGVCDIERTGVQNLPTLVRRIVTQRPEESFVSAQQVADLAGLSRSAVSRTFTEGASVSDATRKRVLCAAEPLGYHVNHLARGLRNDRSDIVCIVGADIDAPYHGLFIEALTRHLQAAGKVAMLVNTSGGCGIESAKRLTLQYRAGASIVRSGQPDRQIIETCISNGQSVMMVNRDEAVAGPQNINVSNRAASREAFHMLHRVGCEHLAVVTSAVGAPSQLARETGFFAEGTIIREAIRQA